MERFTSKPPKDNHHAYVMKNRLVFRQTSKETVEALAREGPHQGQDIVKLPRSASKPRAPSLVVRSRDKQHGVGEEGKRVGVEVVD